MNSHGRDLIEFCKCVGLLIVNGRVGEDRSIGEFSRVDTMGSSLVDYVISSPGLFLSSLGHFEGIRSLVPHLIGPPSHWSPSHWSPNSLVPQIHYWSSLVPHLIGPPYHWSPISLVPLFIRHPIIGQSQWSPISLVPHLIGSPSHWSPNSSVSHLIGPPIGTHASPIPLVPHLIGPPDSLVPHLIGPPTHWSPSHWSPNS